MAIIQRWTQGMYIMNVNITSCIIGELLTIDSLAVFILYLCPSEL